MSVLRVYEPAELGPDGYPFAWHRETLLGVRRHDAIKDLVRAQAGHRCVRCGHPYRNGEHGSGEWTPCDEGCSHSGPHRWRFADPRHGWEGDWLYGDHSEEPWPIAWTPGLQVEAKWRILTVHHLNGDKHDCRWWNLAALCQRCHLTIQGRVVIERAFFLEHSDWFKPYAAGFYAVKYLGEGLDRDVVDGRLEELLALERLA